MTNMNNNNLIIQMKSLIEKSEKYDEMVKKCDELEYKSSKLELHKIIIWLVDVSVLVDDSYGYIGFTLEKWEYVKIRKEDYEIFGVEPSLNLE